MSDLGKLTIAAARDGLRAGEFTAVELAQSCLNEIEGAAALNAFVHHTPDIALAQAQAADVRIRAGDAPSVRHPPGDQRSFLHERRAQPGRQPDIAGFPAGI